ncbi:hypothetical protein SNK05_007784 [Fusarium graminearum]
MALLTYLGQQASSSPRCITIVVVVVTPATTGKRSYANDSAFANCRKGPRGGDILGPRKSLNHRRTKIRSTSLTKSGNHGKARRLPWK